MPSINSAHPSEPLYPSSSDFPPQHQHQHQTSSDDPARTDLTWSDFLRSAAGSAAEPTPITDRSDARKRRYEVGPESDRRDYPFPTSYNTSSPARRQRGDIPPSPVRPASMRHPTVDPTLSRAMIPRRQSGENGSIRSAGWGRENRDFAVNLPRWQPDHEAARCFVCQTEFTFWFRKHHCRKCGRVVCATCSPHRITIPRQYIVVPDAADQMSRDPDSPTVRNPALGGGETVRVCNPCVPDPWTPNAANDVADTVHTMNEELARRSMQRHEERVGGRVVATGPTLASYRRQSDQRAERYRFVPHSGGTGGRHSRSYSYQPPSIASSSHPAGTTASAQHIFNPPHGRAPPIPPSSSRPAGFGGHRHTQSTSTYYPRPPVPPGAFVSSPRNHPIAIGEVRPRRQVREEDECPVCGIEMPPGEAVRETHIQECIAARFSSPSTAATPRPIPARTSSSSGNVASSSTPSRGSIPGLSSTPATATAFAATEAAAINNVSSQQARPRAQSYRPRGMVTYHATEKDCTPVIGDDGKEGEAPECIICFEEFVPGDELGRMECLCKFHRRCIRMWWETKGTGVCPTHALTE